MPAKDKIDVIEIDSDSDYETLPEPASTLGPITGMPVDTLGAKTVNEKATEKTKDQKSSIRSLQTSSEMKNGAGGGIGNDTVVQIRSLDSLPKSRILAGKVFMFRGQWVTMTSPAAEELCAANGGTVVQAITQNPTYLVIGKKGTAQNLDKFKSQGAVVITEADFMDLILRPAPMTLVPQLGTKRPTEPSRSSDKTSPAKKSKAKGKGKEKEKEEIMENIVLFLADRQNEVRLKGRTLEAYDCGGMVRKIQRGKSYVGLLQTFDSWLASCDGDYHRYM